MTDPALALLEFNSIAAGIEAGDAMVKRAPIRAIHAGTVQPGRYLVMVTGDVASVEESVQAGKEMAAAYAEENCLRDHIFLPQVHPGVVDGLAGGRQPAGMEGLGIVETNTVAAAIHAADAGLKGAEVVLAQIRLADGLGGKGLVMFSGAVADVETAVELGAERAAGRLAFQRVIAQLHPEMAENVDAAGRFGTRYGWEA